MHVYNQIMDNHNEIMDMYNWITYIHNQAYTVRYGYQ